MSKHTPTPWKHVHYDETFFTIETMDGNVQTAEAYSEEDAAFIVQACNAHDDLVAALQKVIACLRGTAEIGRRATANMTEQAYNAALAALAKAGASV
jgi:hypothetical protein